MALKGIGLLGVGVLAGSLVTGVLVAGAKALSSADLDRKKTELSRLSADIAAREAALVAAQTRIAGQADTLRRKVAEASVLADQIATGQGSAAERLRRAAAAIRQLRDDLRGIQTSE